MKKNQTLMITLIAFLALATLAYAGNMRGMGMRADDGVWQGRTGKPGYYGCGMMGGACGISFRQLMGLDLTDAQRDQAVAVMEKYRTDQQNLMDQLMAAREACAENRKPDAAFDETAIRESHRAVSAVKEELAVLRGKMMAELKPILTEAQLEALSAGPMNAKGKGKPARGRMWQDCPMMDQWRNTPPSDTE